jgi:hypothetical protein
MPGMPAGYPAGEMVERQDMIVGKDISMQDPVE